MTMYLDLEKDGYGSAGRVWILGTGIPQGLGQSQMLLFVDLL